MIDDLCGSDAGYVKLIYYWNILFENITTEYI